MLNRAGQSCSIYSSVLVYLLIFFQHASSQLSLTDKRNLVNSCIDGNNHKTVPGPEDELHKQVQNLNGFVTFSDYLINHVLFILSQLCIVLAMERKLLLH